MVTPVGGCWCSLENSNNSGRIARAVVRGPISECYEAVVSLRHTEQHSSWVVLLYIRWGLNLTLRWRCFPCNIVLSLVGLGFDGLVIAVVVGVCFAHTPASRKHSTAFAAPHRTEARAVAKHETRIIACRKRSSAKSKDNVARGVHAHRLPPWTLARKKTVHRLHAWGCLDNIESQTKALLYVSVLCGLKRRPRAANMCSLLREPLLCCVGQLARSA